MKIQICDSCYANEGQLTSAPLAIRFPKTDSAPAFSLAVCEGHSLEGEGMTNLEARLLVSVADQKMIEAQRQIVKRMAARKRAFNSREKARTA